MENIGKFAPINLTPRVLTMKEAAAYLKVSYHTLRRMVINGEIRVLRRQMAYAGWLFDVVELDAWVDRNNQKFGACITNHPLYCNLQGHATDLRPLW